MKVWKIGSRWSDTGTKKSSVLDIFDKHRIVFAGRQIDKIKSKVEVGNLIAISDGAKIVRVGQVMSTPQKIRDFSMFDKDDKKRFNYNDEVIGFRVEIFKLDESEIFKTQIGTFSKMKKRAKLVESLYSKKILTSS